MIKHLFVLGLLVSTQPSKSFAQTGNGLRCNSKQNICEIMNRDLLMGDTVAILNDYDQIVALGEVISMSERKRRIKITEKFETIYARHKVKAFYEKSPKEIKEKYSTAAKAGQSMMLSGSLLQLNIDSDAVAFNLEGHYSRPFRNGIYWHGTAQFFTMSGEVSDGFGDQSGQGYDLSAFGFYGGASYPFLTHQSLSFRPIATLGFLWAMPSDSSLQPLQNLNSGFNFGLNVALHARYRMAKQNFTPYGLVEYYAIGSDANGFGFGLGFEMPVKF